MVGKFINGSRDYDCVRYYDMIRRIEDFYKDGIISNEELSVMKGMREETLLNYQIAADMLHKIDTKSKDYAKLTSLVEYLRRCWQMMDFVTDKGDLVNKTQKIPENVLPKKNKDKKITLNIQDEATLALISGLMTSKDRRLANANYIKKSVENIPPEVKKRSINSIIKTLNMLEKEEMDRDILKLKNLESSRQR